MDDMQQTIQDLKAILKRNIPDAEKLTIQRIIESLEDIQKHPYVYDDSPEFEGKKKYHVIYKKRVGKT